MSRIHLRGLLLLLLLVLLLCGCSGNRPLVDGETYLEGSWYYDDGNLHVGYNFFPDGTGFQFIGETVNPIRYGVTGEEICVSVAGDGMTRIPFEATGEDLLIGGLLFKPVPADEALESSIQTSLSSENASAQAQPTEEDQPPVLLFMVISVALAVLVVGFAAKKFGLPFFLQKK